MKGVILAGGTGTRLYPLTRVTNKHLLPIYDEPMIYYPIRTLIAAGITDILIIVGGESTGDFLKLLGSGEELGVNITYRCQVGAGGIPTALSLAKEFVDGENFMVVLGDNVTTDSLEEHTASFSAGARIFLKSVADPHRYGVALIQGEEIVSIEEKPQNPKGDLAITGVYLFDAKVFDIIPALSSSERGETEIVDVLADYQKRNALSYGLIKGDWTDAGTLEALYHANVMMREKKSQK